VDDCEISQDEVYYLLEKDIYNAIKDAVDLIGVWTFPVVLQEVIIEMVFQLGKTGVSKFKLMWQALRKHEFVEAAFQMRDSKWHRQTPNRCDELAAIVEAIKCFADN